MRIRDRIRYNFTSSGVGFIVYGLGQLLLIPVFLRNWSTDMMGEWMVLWSIPNILWTIEQIIIGASSSKLIHLQTLGKLDEGNVLFHNLLFIYSRLAIAFLVLSLVCLFALPIATLLNLREITFSDAQFISALILIMMSLAVFSNIVRLPFSAVGRYWLASTHQTFTQAAVILIQAILLWHPATSSPRVVALGILGVYGLSLCVLLFVFYFYASPYTIRWKRPSSESLKGIIGDNFPMMGFTFSQSLMVQCFFVSIQLSLGPYYVAAFSSLKTLSRFFYQGSNIVLNSTYPDLAAAVARRDKTTIKKIGKLQFALILPGFFLFTCCALLFHNIFLFWWTHGKVAFSNKEILIFLVGIFFLTLWSRKSQFLLASLQHRRFFTLAFGFSFFYASIIYGLKTFFNFEFFLAVATLYEICLYLIARNQSRSANTICS